MILFVLHILKKRWSRTDSLKGWEYVEKRQGSRQCKAVWIFPIQRTLELQYKAERLGWSSSLLLQTEAALIGDYGREQIDYRYELYMTPLQKTQTIPLSIFMTLTLRRWVREKPFKSHTINNAHVKSENCFSWTASLFLTKTSSHERGYLPDNKEDMWLKKVFPQHMQAL